MTDFNDIAKDLGIKKQGQLNDNTYTIIFADSNEYAQVYTILDNSDDLELVDENSFISDSICTLVYEANDYNVELVGNFDEDKYYVQFKN